MPWKTVLDDMSSLLRRIRDFGTRSRLVYGLMIASSLLALGSAFLIPGQVGVVSFVAFFNFTAGLWIAQLIHSLGHTAAGEPEPVVMEGVGEEPTVTAPKLFEDIAWERFLRIAVVVAAAATVFVFTATEVLSPQVSAVALGAIGAIALLAAMIGFLIAAAATLGHENRTPVAGTAVAEDEHPDDEATAAGEDG